MFLSDSNHHHHQKNPKPKLPQPLKKPNQNIPALFLHLAVGKLLEVVFCYMAMPEKHKIIRGEESC